MPEKKPLSWQQILGTVVLLVITGVISYFGATIKGTIDQSSRNAVDIELLRSDMQKTISDLQKSISDLGGVAGDLKEVQITQARLEAIVERLEKNVR